MNIIFFNLCLFLVVLALVLVGQGTNAQTSFTDYLDNLPGAQINLVWLFNILGTFACYLIQFAIIAFGVMIVVYGIMYIKGMGNVQEAGRVKTSLTWGVVGGFVIFGVFTIILSLGNLIGVSYPILNIVRVRCGS